MFNSLQQLGIQTDLVHDLRDVLKGYPKGNSDIVEETHYDFKDQKSKSTQIGSPFNKASQARPSYPKQSKVVKRLDKEFYLYLPKEEIEHFN